MAYPNKKIKRPLCSEALLICHIARAAHWERLAKMAAATAPKVSPAACQIAGVNAALAKATPESLAKTYLPADPQDFFCELLRGEHIDRLAQLGHWPPTQRMVDIVLKPPGKTDEERPKQLAKFLQNLNDAVLAEPQAVRTILESALGK